MNQWILKSCYTVRIKALSVSHNSYTLHFLAVSSEESWHIYTTSMFISEHYSSTVKLSTKVYLEQHSLFSKQKDGSTTTMSMTGLKILPSRTLSLLTMKTAYKSTYSAVVPDVSYSLSSLKPSTEESRASFIFSASKIFGEFNTLNSFHQDAITILKSENKIYTGHNLQHPSSSQISTLILNKSVTSSINFTVSVQSSVAVTNDNYKPSPTSGTVNLTWLYVLLGIAVFCLGISFLLTKLKKKILSKR